MNDDTRMVPEPARIRTSFGSIAANALFGVDVGEPMFGCACEEKLGENFDEQFEEQFEEKVSGLCQG